MSGRWVFRQIVQETLTDHSLEIKKSIWLMLWRTEKTPDDVVGNSGQGIYWQGLDITHQPDETHRMGGLGTWRHAKGVPHACTARRTLDFHLPRTLISQSGSPTAPAVVAAPIRKLCEAKFALSRPQTCSRLHRLLVSDAQVGLCPSVNLKRGWEVLCPCVWRR